MTLSDTISRHPLLAPVPVGYPPPVHTYDEIKALVHECYRALMPFGDEADAHRTAHALCEQLMGREVEALRFSHLLTDVWTVGKRTYIPTPPPTAL